MKTVVCRVILVALMAFMGTAVRASADATPLSCARSAPGYAHCDAEVLGSPQNVPLVSARPSGYGPAQFRSAYTIPLSAGTPTTVGVVIAYHDAGLVKDLSAFDAALGLSSPPRMQQFSQRGGLDYPAADSGWALEESLDVETIHGICQKCNLVVIEADSASTADLLAAEDMAVVKGARVISNSWGAPEAQADVRSNKHFQHAGVRFVASSGDDGYGVEYPAASPSVVAVGGTTLKLTAAGLRSSETVWSGSGSGCSQYEAKPTWQHDTGCLGRTVADVAADADPATGAAVYDSTSYQGRRGWVTLGGTSLAAPLVAGMYGLVGSGGVGASGLYGATLRDVVSGTNGSCRSYLCAARVGFDGPSGNGSPSGLTAFH